MEQEVILKTKLWRIHQGACCGYDTYDSAVVAAYTEEDARMTHPSELHKDWDGKRSRYFASWPAAEEVSVEYLGVTERDIPNKTVICSSFNAG